MDRRCADCRKLISAYIDGELNVDERAWLRNHLATCEECRAVLNAYKHVGTAVRTLPPLQPPTQLASTIYARTIDAEPRRLMLFTNRLGYSLGGVAAILVVFVVAGYLLVGGYQRSITPEVTSSNPTNGQKIQPNTPIEIRFNKEMNRQSVEAALGMQPLGAEVGLIKSWDGNTLIIGGNKLLTPSTDYTITISDDARDKWGNRLNQSFELSFGTNSTVALVIPTAVVPTYVPTTTPTPDRVVNAEITPVAEPTVAPDQPGTGGGDPTETPQIIGPIASATPGSGDGSDDDGIGTLDPTATPTPAVDDDPDPTSPTWTPTTEPTATPSPTATLPAPTSIATATSSPTASPSPTVPPATPTVEPPATPTVEPPVTPTPDVIPVIGDIGNVYWGNSSIQDRLGGATDFASTTTAQTLGFQHASMLYRADNGMIYVMPTGIGIFDQYVASLDSLPNAEPGPEVDTWTPGGVFGYLWWENPSISDEVGYAVQPSSADHDSTVQTFENGFMIIAGGYANIFYNDGTWDLLVVN